MKRHPPLPGGGGPSVGGGGTATPIAPRIEPVASGFPRVYQLAIRLGSLKDTWILRTLRLRLRRPSLDMEIGDAGCIRFAPPATGPVGWHHALGGRAESGRVGALRYVQAGVWAGDVTGLFLGGQSMCPPRLAPKSQMGQALENHQSASGCRGPQALRGSGRLAAHCGGLLFRAGLDHLRGLCFVLLLVGTRGGKLLRLDGRGLGSPTSRSGASSGERDGSPSSWDGTRRYGRARNGEFDRDLTSARLRIGLGGRYGATPQRDSATGSSLARLETRRGVLPSHDGSAVALPMLVGKVGKSQNCPLLRNSAGRLGVPGFRATVLPK